MIYFVNGDHLDCQRKNLRRFDELKNISMEIDEATGAVKLWLSGKSGQGKYALVDREDWKKIAKWSWQLRKNGYVGRTGNKNGKQFSMLLHRFIMNAWGNMQVDHVNMKRLDNRKINLRLCNNAQNNINRPKNGNNTSGFKGIEPNNSKSKWRAKLAIKGKRFYSRFYNNKIEAAKAYDRLARKYFGDFAKTNF